MIHTRELNQLHHRLDDIRFRLLTDARDQQAVWRLLLKVSDMMKEARGTPYEDDVHGMFGSLTNIWKLNRQPTLPVRPTETVITCGHLRLRLN